MPYRLRIDGDDGLSVDRLVAKELVLRMLQLDEWAVGISSTKVGGTEDTADAEAKVDPRAFLLESGANTNMAKIAALGIFLSAGGKNLFGPTEIRDLLIRCGERPPANLGRDFKETERLRWIARDAKHRGQWFVTNDARRAHEGSFANEGPTRVASRASRAKKTQRVNVAAKEEATKKPSVRGTDARAESADAEQPSGIGRGITATGPMAVIDMLCAEKFFAEWRSTGDIIAEAARRGFTLSRTDTTSLLPKYVRKKKLAREKRSRDGVARGVWHYAYVA